MIVAIRGILEASHPLAAHVRPEGTPGLLYEVLVPAYLAERLAARIGEPVELFTLHTLEGQGPGTTMTPRLVGFLTPRDLKFFDLFTTVKGVGTRKALKALAQEPAAIARFIAARDAKALKQLPEIGPRLAETIIAELTGKVEPFLAAGEIEALERASASAAPAPRPADRLSGVLREAASALIALGEKPADAERLVLDVQARDGSLDSPEAIIARALSARR